MKISHIDSCRCMVGECPVWDEREHVLYFLDIAQRHVHRFNPVSGELTTWTVPAEPAALALRESGGAVVAIKDTVYSLDFETGECLALSTTTEQPANATFNDGKVDRQGRLILGSCTTDFANPTPIGGIFSLTAGGQCKKLAGDIMFSNGPCFSPDGRTLYFADSGRQSIFAYDYVPETGEIGERRLFAQTGELQGLPDGATVDSSGLLWVAINQGGKVAAFRPDGRIERVIDLPASHPGSLTFGGPELDRLYVTTIDPAYFGQPTAPSGGYIHVIEGLGVKGLAEPRFAG